jgi:hypothetical protein
VKNAYDIDFGTLTIEVPVSNTADIGFSKAKAE